MPGQGKRVNQTQRQGAAATSRRASAATYGVTSRVLGAPADGGPDVVVHLASSSPLCACRPSRRSPRPARPSVASSTGTGDELPPWLPDDARRACRRRWSTPARRPRGGRGGLARGRGRGVGRRRRAARRGSGTARPRPGDHALHRCSSEVKTPSPMAVRPARVRSWSAAAASRGRSVGGDERPRSVPGEGDHADVEAVGQLARRSRRRPPRRPRAGSAPRRWPPSSVETSIVTIDRGALAGHPHLHLRPGGGQARAGRRRSSNAAAGRCRRQPGRRGTSRCEHRQRGEADGVALRRRCCTT